jgi:DNA ligase D-like protein (predicted ligase)
VDRRRLGDVIWHEEPGHEPIALELSFIEPMLPTLAAEPPEGDDWLHEIKYDGYRTQLVIEGSSVKAFTRNGHDWTKRYEPTMKAARELACQSAILDGEMIVQDEQGRSDFSAFKRAMERRPETLVFMAFDLLHLNGRDLRQEPLIERRLRLQVLVGCNDPSCRIQFSDHVIGNGADLFEAADAIGLEGIVSKKSRSRYRTGRSGHWLKIKCFAEAEFVVIGVEWSAGRPPTALLAREEDGQLVYAGGAMVTLGACGRDDFWRAVERLSANAPPVPGLKASAGKWLTPKMRVRARYLKGSDKLRHATLKELVGETVA